MRALARVLGCSLSQPRSSGRAPVCHPKLVRMLPGSHLYPLCSQRGGVGNKIPFQLPHPQSHIPRKPLETLLCGQSGGASTESAARAAPTPAEPDLGRARSVWKMGWRKRSRAPSLGLPRRWRLHFGARLTHPRLPSQGSRQLKKDKIKRSNSPALTSARGFNSPAAA